LFRREFQVKSRFVANVVIDHLANAQMQYAKPFHDCVKRRHVLFQFRLLFAWQSVVISPNEDKSLMRPQFGFGLFFEHFRQISAQLVGQFTSPKHKRLSPVILLPGNGKAMSAKKKSSTGSQLPAPTIVLHHQPSPKQAYRKPLCRLRAFTGHPCRCKGYRGKGSSWDF
jgi:hypothetical protein